MEDPAVELSPVSMCVCTLHAVGIFQLIRILHPLIILVLNGASLSSMKEINFILMEYLWSIRS